MAGRSPNNTERSLAETIETSKAPAISRAAAVLRVLGKSDAPLPAQAIARELGLVPSTCLYILRALVTEGLVALDPATKRYSLDAGVLTLARDWLRRNRMTDLAQPVLDRISRTFDTTVFCVQVFGLDYVVVIAVSQSGRDFEYTAQLGARFSALLSATGRCVAAFSEYSDQELKAKLDSHYLSETPPFEVWKAQLEQTRKDGIAMDEGAFMSGMTMLAAPVWKSPGSVTHALIGVGFASLLARTGRLPELRNELRSAAQTLSRQLCGEDPPTAANGRLSK